MNKCPCCQTKKYLTCCGRFIKLKQTPETPEELMRSRYTAYTLANIDYIIETMKSPASDHFDRASAKKWASKADWKKLEVLSAAMEGNKGKVEFVAYYTIDGTLNTIHEISEFRYEDGKWYYVNGKYLA